MRYLRIALLGLLAAFVAILAVSPAPLAADHGKLSLTPVLDRPLATVSLRHSLPGHPGQEDQRQVSSAEPACDKDVDLTSTSAGVIPIAAQDNPICTSSDIDMYEGQDGKTYVVQAGGQDAAWVHTDVSNPSSPVLISYWLWADPGGANTYTPDVKAFSQSGSDYIALALERLAPTAFCGVVIMDVTDPLNPTLVRQLVGAGWCDVHNVFVEKDGSGDGRYLYLTADSPNDLRVLDIDDLNNISEIGRYTHPEASSSNYVHDVTVVDHGGSIGRRVYVSYWNAGLMILDASDLTPGVIESGSPNQPLNPDHSIDPAGFLMHHAYPSEDGSRVFIEDEITFVAGFEPVQMWDISSPASPSYVDGVSLGSALMPIVNPAHNLLVNGERLYVGWYKAGLQGFDFDSTGFVGRPIYHQVQTETDDDPYDGAWGVRLATIGTDTYVFQSDRRHGLIVDRLDLCSALANPGQADTDGDGVINTCDNCPAWPNSDQSSPPWSVPADDADCDGWSSADETSIGTDSNLACSLTGVVTDPGDPTKIDDEPVDNWPADMNDDQVVNLSDVLYLAPPVFFSIGPNPPYQLRYDLNLDGVINLSDILTLAPPMFFSTCTP